MSIKDIIKGKKYWWAHVARIKALPPDYRIVYQEMQQYFFKVGPVDLADGRLLAELLDFFEESAAEGRTATEVVGTDVAAFADNLIKDTPTYADLYRASRTRQK